MKETQMKERRRNCWQRKTRDNKMIPERESKKSR